MMDVQFSFQGGGAKFIDLLASAAAIQERQKKAIRVTRVSGSSAGSIVAAIIASGADVKKIGEFLDKNGDKYHRLIAGKYMGGFQRWNPLHLHDARKRLKSGTSFFSSAELHNFLTEMFNYAGVSNFEKISDLEKQTEIKLLITGSNIDDASGCIFKDHDPLVRSIVNSCALPFIFRATGDLSNNPYVDGGLCDNLPAEYLLDDKEKYGEILGVSFARKPNRLDSKTLFNNTIGYLIKIFDASMNHNIKRTKDILGASNYLEIESDIETLDFSKSMKRHYETNRSGELVETSFFANTKNTVLGWIDQHLAVHRKKATISMGGLTGKFGHEDDMKTTYRIYRNLFENSDWHYTRATMIVYVNSLNSGSNEYDVIDRQFVLQTGESPVYCAPVRVKTTGVPASPTPTNFTIKYNKTGKRIPVEILPSINERESSNLNSIQCLIYFKTPLESKNGVPQLVDINSQYPFDNIMSDLLRDGYDTFTLRNSRPKIIDIVDIILAVPKTYRELTIVSDRTKGERQGKVLDEEEIVKRYKGIDSGKYRLYGMRCRRLGANKRFGIGVSHKIRD